MAFWQKWEKGGLMTRYVCKVRIERLDIMKSILWSKYSFCKCWSFEKVENEFQVFSGQFEVSNICCVAVLLGCVAGGIL